jgi:hypothetical protein
MNRSRLLSVSFFALFASLAAVGCAGLGNVVVHNHPNSLVETAGVPTLTIEEATAGCPESKDVAGKAAVAVAPIAAKAVELAADQLISAIEKESKRYGATYSARASTMLYQRCKDGSYRQVATRFTFRRPVADDGIAFELSGDLVVSNEASVLRIVPTHLRIEKTKAKVAWFSAWPWHWPSDVVLGPWQLADPDIRKVDFNASISVEAIAVRGNTVSASRVGPYPIPLGKFAITGTPIVDEQKADLAAAASPYLPLPLVEAPYGLAANVTVSIEEANSLGDPIKDAAEKAREKRDGWVEKLIDAITPKEKEESGA